MKPKIIFISGIPSSGKTTISRLVAQKIKVDKIVDLDILKESQTNPNLVINTDTDLFNELQKRGFSVNDILAHFSK